jgi:hypothetical protein
MAGTPTDGDKGGTNLLSGTTQSIIEQTKALKTNAEALAQNPALLGNVSLAEDEAAQKTKKFSEALKDQAIQSAQALSITNQLTGAVTGFIGKLTQAASLSRHYGRMLDEVNEAQKLYIGSVNFSTASLGKASEQMQRHITVLNRMKIDALDLSKKYKVSVKEFDKVNTEVMGKFSAQIMAVAGGREKLKKITESIFVMARTAGMESAEALEFMGQRGAATNKTVGALDKDMKLLAISTDAYKNKLKELGVDTQRTLLTSKQLVNVLGDMQKNFEYGAVNIKVFGGLMGDFAAKLQGAGMSSNVAQKNLMAMNKLFSDMSRPDLSDFFGTTVSMNIARTGGEGIIQDEKIKQRVKEQLDKARQSGVTNQVQLASIAGEAAQGDIGFQRAQAQDLLKKTKGGGPILHEILKGKGFSPVAAVEMVGTLKKLASMSDEDLKSGKKENKEMLESFNKLQKATEEGSTPEEKSYKAVIGIRHTTEKLERYVTQKLGIAIAAAVGGTIATALIARAATQKALGLLAAGGATPAAAATQKAWSLIAAGGAAPTAAAATAGGLLSKAGAAAGKVWGGMQAATSKVIPFGGRLASAAASGSKLARLGLGAATGGIGIVLMEMVGGLLKTKGLWGSIKNMFTSLGSALSSLGKVVSTILTPFRWLGGLLGKFVSGVFKELGDKLKWLSDVLGTASKYLGKFWGGVSDITNWIGRKLGILKKEPKLLKDIEIATRSIRAEKDATTRMKVVDEILKSRAFKEEFGEEGQKTLLAEKAKAELELAGEDKERQKEIIKSALEGGKITDEARKEFAEKLDKLEARIPEEKKPEEVKPGLAEASTTAGMAVVTAAGSKAVQQRKEQDEYENALKRSAKAKKELLIKKLNSPNPFYRNEALETESMAPMPPAVRKQIDSYLKARGMEIRSMADFGKLALRAEGGAGEVRTASGETMQAASPDEMAKIFSAVTKEKEKKEAPPRLTPEGVEAMNDARREQAMKTTQEVIIKADPSLKGDGEVTTDSTTDETVLILPGQRIVLSKDAKDLAFLPIMTRALMSGKST